MAGFDDDLRFAHVLADAADDITMRRFRALDLNVQSKPDLTPVTDADLATEESLRGVLRRARPRDAMLGEEFGRSGTSPRCWIIDPIDGTQNFVRGVPVWATLVGLMADGEVTVGVVTAPAIGRRWWAAQDGGAWTGRSLTKATACRVSEVTRLEDASLSYSDLATWEASGRLDGFLGLADQGVRGLLVARAGRRGRGGRLGGGRCLALGRGRAAGDRGRSRRGLHRPVRQAHPGRRERAVHERRAARRGARHARLAVRGLMNDDLVITSSQARPPRWHWRHRPLAESLR